MKWFAGVIQRFGGGGKDGVKDMQELKHKSNRFIIVQVAAPKARIYRHRKTCLPIEEVSLAPIWFLIQPCRLTTLTGGMRRNLKILRDVGFSEVYPTRRKHSRFAPLRDPLVFDTVRPNISLYIEARK